MQHSALLGALHASRSERQEHEPQVLHFNQSDHKSVQVGCILRFAFSHHAGAFKCTAAPPCSPQLLPAHSRTKAAQTLHS